MGLPTFILAISASSISLNPPDHTEDDTYSRDNAEHFCPFCRISKTTKHLNTPFTLVFESTSDRLQHSVPNLCTLVDKMKVLSTRLADNFGVPFVHIHVRSNVLPELFKDESAAGEMEGSKHGMF